MASPTTVDVSKLLDEQKVSSFQIRVLVLCALVDLLEGFNAQVIGYLGPPLAHSLHLSHRQMGFAFASALLGIMAGTLTLGSLADRFGRRRTVIACTFIFGVFSTATAFVNSLGALMLFRLLAGMGLGGTMPNIVSLTAEFSPKRIRGTMLMAMFTGFPVGAMVAGFAAAPMIPAFGWRAVFGLSGAMPILLVPALLLGLPESIHHLVVEGGKSRQISSLLARINPSLVFPEEVNFILGEVRAVKASVGSLFRQRRAWLTILLWVVFFVNLLDVYLLTSWFPTVFHTAGMALSLSIVAAALFPAGAASSSILLGRALDRFGTYRVLALTFVGGAVSVALLGEARSAVAVMILTFCAGVGIMGGQMEAMFAASSIYPTSIRSTGVGWALGIGRIGSIIGPIFGGLMLAGHWPLHTIFLASAAPALVGATAVYIMGRVHRGTGVAVPTSPPLEPSGSDARGA